MNAAPERNPVGLAAWICLAVAWACFLHLYDSHVAS